jgi:hypothetical protein
MSMVSTNTSPDLPNGFPEFAQAQQTSTVRIENIPVHGIGVPGSKRSVSRLIYILVDRRELVALFRTLIGTSTRSRLWRSSY